MNILYTCDDNYVWQMGISLISLFENNKDSKIIIYLIHSNVTQSNQKKLIEIVNKYNKSIVFLSLDEINICPLLKENGRWPLVCYARLFFHHVIKDCDRLLYLDCDTLVLSNIEELFSDRYSKFAIYGAKDFIANFYKKLIGMPVEASNINGGVLLFNLKLYCELSPDSRIFSFITKYGNRISYADQDVINGTFWNEFGFLEAKYNVMSIMRCFNYSEIIKLKHPRGGYSEQEVNKAISYPCIIHFTGNYRYTRPWIHNSNHPYKDYFELYKKISPWSDMPMMKILSEKVKLQ
ncbi:glycosyltransferase family 8 protein [Succinivibrio dextrinosolvens]|uniref:glycosyltransferase family 8 protein n=1 Tax=Succinivibrio dextrinosolvens TaxID=83771 RepID=UPI0013E96E06|nr:glycosyltransferase family 8 protein [Succinivibrio dextrinosolvens]